MSGNYEIDDVRKLESDVGILELELLNGKCVLESKIGIHMLVAW
jgi:hypothetical protein